MPEVTINKKIRVKKVFSAAFSYTALIFIGFICAGPFLWLLLSSLRTGANIYSLDFAFKDFSFANYTGVMSYMKLHRYLWNTILITFGTIFIDVLFSSMCAYPLATMFGVILPSSVKAFSIILLRQAYLGVPKELIDAAKIDGAGQIRTLFNVMLPGIIPSISTIVIFDFIGSWNSFLWPIIVLQDTDKYPLATALQYLNGSFNYKFGYVAAGTVLSIIPVLIVFMLCQKNYIQAVSGAVKG